MGGPLPLLLDVVVLADGVVLLGADLLTAGVTFGFRLADLFVIDGAMEGDLVLVANMAVIRLIFLYKIRNPRTADLLPDHFQLLW